MRIFLLPAILIAATVAVPPAAAQAPVSPQRELSALLRQDAGLRQRIGRIQLDALVARVDQTVGHRSRLDARADKGAALQHDLDLYAF